MTTGRINQVTTIHFCSDTNGTNATLTDGSSSNQLVEELITAMKPQLRPPCSPDLTNFKHSSPCHKEQQGLWPSKRTTNNRSTNMLTAVAVDSQMANCNRFGYQQATHILHSLQAPQKYLSCQAGKKKNFPVAWLNHPKSVLVCQDRCINGLDQEKPVIPTQKAYWTRTMSCGQPFRDYSNMKVLDFNWSRVT